MWCKFRGTTLRRRILKNLYIILLLTFGLSQDYSLSFDRNDAVEVLYDTTPLTELNNLSLEVWVKQNSLEVNQNIL